jgi:c-di-GMP-binding flagellar brake protein YcgR
MTQLSSGVALPLEESADRRRWPRYAIDVRLRATVRTGNADRTVHGRGTEMGKGGMAALLPIELAIGDTIKVDITFPYCTQSITLAAVVRNRSSFTYGVEFMSINSAQQAEIERVCRLLAILQ